MYMQCCRLYFSWWMSCSCWAMVLWDLLLVMCIFFFLVDVIIQRLKKKEKKKENTLDSYDFCILICSNIKT